MPTRTVAPGVMGHAEMGRGGRSGRASLAVAFCGSLVRTWATLELYAGRGDVVSLDSAWSTSVPLRWASSSNSQLLFFGACRRTPCRSPRFCCCWWLLLICASASRTRSNAYTHVKLHMESGRQFQCNLCPYRTHISSNLTKHERTHEGQASYSCMLCPYTTVFTRGTNRLGGDGYRCRSIGACLSPGSLSVPRCS